MTNFNFDENAFKREVNKQVQSAVSEIARGMTRDFDRLRQQYKGQPVEVIKPEIRRVFEKDGGSITDPELTDYAKLISNGQHIEVVPEDIKL